MNQFIHDSFFGFDETRINQTIRNLDRFGSILSKNPFQVVEGRDGIVYRRDYDQISQDQQPILQFGSEGKENGQFELLLELQQILKVKFLALINGIIGFKFLIMMVNF